MEFSRLKQISILVILIIAGFSLKAQVEEASNFSVISDALSELNSATGWAMQDNGKWASRQNTIPHSDFKTLRNPSPKHSLGKDNFLEFELRKVLIEDKQYNVLIKLYRDGEFEFPVIEEEWEPYNSVEFYVFPAENLKKILPEDVHFGEPYAVNLDVFTYGKITNYNPYLVTDKIVNRINSTLNSTYINTANLIVGVWPKREEENEMLRFKLIKTFNKPSISSYYLDPGNVHRIFASNYYETYYYRFKDFIRDAELFNIPLEKDPDGYMSYYRWGVIKYQAGNYEGALEDFNKALKLNPGTGDFMIYSYRGNTKSKLRDFNGAIEDFDRALAIEPEEVIDYSNWIRNYFNRGVAKFYINDRDGACEDWHHAYELGYGLALEYLNKYCQ